VALTARDAYDATGAAWEAGPGLVYNRLAEVIVAAAPVALEDRTVADLGAGTGAASRAIAAAGGTPVAVDAARGMLAAGAGTRAHAVQADIRSLPFRDGAFGGVVAAFSLNHVADTAAALREAARVVESGGPLVASSYAEEDAHPVRGAVETALGEAGWEPEPWQAELRTGPVARLSTADRCAAVAAAAGLSAQVRAVHVPFPGLRSPDLVAWRLGMAQHAPFVAGLTPPAADRLRRRALELLGDDPPPLIRSILIIAALA